ncbi:MAG TPA: NADH:ubiquinone reductase (Na(+)-transporting) subunit B [Cytophagales bacterium]|jgi:Na+-transporting NADH:ubiquinone oxidoreductase subunit B|nr:NADH:ubiquinone reductase (Na(+)-transporting) subunit B [Cytophagales bacterium]
MKFIRKIFDTQKSLFQKGGKFEKGYYLFEALEAFLFVPDHVTSKKGVQVKDAIDLKRLMMTVVIAMIPCLLFGIWNVGHQHFLANGSSVSFLEKIIFGSKIVLPVVLVSYTAGGIVEVIFSTIRRHPINEGFLVTGMLIPLIMPPGIPLWQVALATVFAITIAKEVFGGTGMNILNVALTARVFLYFGFPSDISGDVWTYYGNDNQELISGYSGATPLYLGASTVDNVDSNSLVYLLDEYSEAINQTEFYSFQNMFLGAIPGSIGETSTLMCLIGAFILIFTGVGSWRIMLSVFLGAYCMGFLFNLIGSNEFMLIPPEYHFVFGGLAFGAIFMATDPVTAAQTERGKWIYGFMIGLLTVVIRIFNPAYPEGIMLAILFMNVFAPLIDFYIVKANKKRRLKRATV